MSANPTSAAAQCAAYCDTHRSWIRWLDRHGVEVVDPPTTLRLDEHEIGVAQHGQVLDDDVATFAEGVDELAGRLRPVPERIEHGTAERVRERLPDGIIVV